MASSLHHQHCAKIFSESGLVISNMGTGKQAIVFTIIISGASLPLAGLYFGSSVDTDPIGRIITGQESAKLDSHTIAVQPTLEKRNPRKIPEIIANDISANSEISDTPQLDTKIAFTPEQKVEYYELGSRMISDLASESTTLPELLNSEELTSLSLSAQVYVVKMIVVKINNKELDIEKVWPD